MPPQDTSVLVDTVATFNCTGLGDILKWTYESRTIEELTKHQHQISIVHYNLSDGVVSSTLSINATVNNDGAAIGCTIINFTSGALSMGSILYVIRISPVRNLSLLIDNVPYISWTIPSVIATDILVSNLRYTVKLEGDNIVNTISDINDTYYQFNDTTVVNCTVYTANVTAYDNTHYSYSSETITAKKSMINTCKGITKVVITIDLTISFQILLYLQQIQRYTLPMVTVMLTSP